nr:hypothetical protein [Tanacetum cinerariifolium]
MTSDAGKERLSNLNSSVSNCLRMYRLPISLQTRKQLTYLLRRMKVCKEGFWIWVGEEELIRKKCWSRFEFIGCHCWNQDDDGVATDKSLNKASLESGNTPRDDHVAPNVENRRLNTTARNEVDVVVPTGSIRAMGEWFANTAYGFFLGKWVAYPAVANYNLDVNLLKEDVGNVPVWVKLYGVPVTAFSEDSLSVIATKLGTLLMLDSYTSNICMQSGGRSSYARAIIELWSDVELKDTIRVAMHKLVGEGFYTCTIRVEYEWKTPRCACYKVFGHVQDECLNNIGSGVAKNLKNPSQDT